MYTYVFIFISIFVFIYFYIHLYIYICLYHIHIYIFFLYIQNNISRKYIWANLAIHGRFFLAIHGDSMIQYNLHLKCWIVICVVDFPVSSPHRNRVFSYPGCCFLLKLKCATVKSRYIGDGHPTFNDGILIMGPVNPYGLGLMSLSPIIWKCHGS